MALDYGVGRIVVDNIYEMEQLNRLAEEKHLVAPILLRIKPGVDAHTHNFIRTGQIDSKLVSHWKPARHTRQFRRQSPIRTSSCAVCTATSVRRFWIHRASPQQQK